MSSSRLPSLTGLRFIAALLVSGFHIHTAGLFADATVDRSLGRVFGAGAIGVSFFFLLSGFVLTWSSRPGDTAPMFWRRRLTKIWPNHVVTAIVAGAALFAFGEAPTVVAIVCNLFLVQAWVPVEHVFYGLNTPSWSLSCELLFYLCFPLLLWLSAKVRRRWLWPALLAALAAVWVVPLVAGVLPRGIQYWLVYVCPPIRMIEFVAGVLLARIVRNGLWIRLGVVPAAVLAVGAYLAAGLSLGPYSYAAVTVAPLALLIGAVAAADVAGRSSPLASPLAVRLGELSFAFYLVHQLVIRVVAGVLGQHNWSTPAGAGVALLILAGSLAAAWLLWRLIETPAMRLARPRRASVHAPAYRNPSLVLGAVDSPAVADEGATAA